MCVCLLERSVLGGRCFSHPLCLDMFLPVIPISVAMAADAEHVEERRPHPLPVMELERQTETCAHFNLLVVSQTTKKKSTVTGITIRNGEHKQKTATGQKHIHWYVSHKVIPDILTPYEPDCLQVHSGCSRVYLF